MTTKDQSEALATCPNVFVYGSLLSGMHNHQVLRNHHPKFIGSGETDSSWFMLPMGGGFYPALVCPFVLNGKCPSMFEFEPDKKMPVVGEVWEIQNSEAMAALDRLESYPRFYDRKVERIHLPYGNDPKGMTVDAWIYHLADPQIGHTQQISNGVVVPGNDWRPYFENLHQTRKQKSCERC